MGEQSESKKPDDFHDTMYALNDSSKIKYLIFHRDDKDGKILVYVDHENDLEWECSDKAQQICEEKSAGSLGRICNDVALLEPIAAAWPDDLKLMTKRLLGEALARVLRADAELADIALQNAKKFINEKKV